MTDPCCGLNVIFCGFISHLIGRETINIPEIFSGVHGFLGKTVNNSNAHKVNKTRKPEKAAFENIIRSAAVRIATTTLLAFEPGLRVSSLQGNRTFREFNRGQDVQTLVVSATPYRLSHQQQLRKRSSFIWRQQIQNYKLRQTKLP